MYTIIVTTEGRVYHYPCAQRIDAELLFKAMCVYISGGVELWQGSTCLGSTFTEAEAEVDALINGTCA